MTATFVAETARIAGELRRSNITLEVKNAINDAILEAGSTRFFFNEIRGLAIATVNGTDNYPDQNLVEIDDMYYTVAGTKTRIYPKNNDEINVLNSSGSLVTGPPIYYSRVGKTIRLYPTPDAVYAVTADGFYRLLPSPLAADTDTNEWLGEGERLIRALAKRNVLRDVIKDFQEASVYEAIATDIKDELLAVTTQRVGTGRISSTQW